MQFCLIIISIVLTTLQIDTSVATTYPIYDHICFCGCQQHRSDYIYIPELRSEYKLHIEPYTWNEARKICYVEDGHLAVPNSKEELQILQNIFQNGSSDNGAIRQDLAWLGVHNHFADNEWVTVLGEILVFLYYDGWNRENCLDFGRQPDNWNGNQHCAALIRDCGTMDDNICNWRLAFLCERPNICDGDDNYDYV